MGDLASLEETGDSSTFGYEPLHMGLSRFLQKIPEKGCKISSLVIIFNLYDLENALLDKEETITINDMALNFQEEIRSFIRSLPDVELIHDPMSEEAYFYGLRNFAHFHGPRHIDIRLSKPQQEEALRRHIALHHQYAPQAGWVSCVIETVEQAENTKLLIRQAYDTCVSLKTRFKSAK